MPRRNRHPGSGKPPHNGPATGIPAMGAGWGGPGKGVGTGRQRARAAPLITAETAREMAGRSHAPAAQVRRQSTIATREELLGILTELARSGEHEMTRVHAADRLLQRAEGQTVKPERRIDVSRLTPQQQELLLEAIEAGIVTAVDYGPV